ncbi:MAG: FAD-binding oxidoreductase [Saprospiraceae bacterium]|nr:FAD-binding oxidoreductase [Saprospiraceae bacterium]
MIKVDYIIVGQGLAGSVLAFLLMQKGQSVMIFDNYTEGSKKASSQIAAGVINPITGMRFVKTWRIDELLPVAYSTYKEIETVLGIKLWHDRHFIRVLRHIEEENNWLLRQNYADYASFCGQIPPSVSESLEAHFKPHYAYATVNRGAQVNLPLLVSRFKTYFKDNACFTNGEIISDDLIVSTTCVQYKNIEAQKIIFCEGAKGSTNPYFSYLPFNPDKGELLLVRIPNLNWTNIYKNKMAIVPLHDTEGATKDLYWVGATNTWAFENDQPEERAKLLIINELKSNLNTDFEVVFHQAAIRPTVKDRRPFIGLHPKHPNIAIFNGFGTKGTSLVPFWANHFTDFLLQNTPLDKEVDICRFSG